MGPAVGAALVVVFWIIGGKQGWADGMVVTATVRVEVPNFLLNAGFEEDDLAMWKFDSKAATFNVVTDNVAAAIDQRVVNFWDGAAYDFSLSQTVTGLEPGTYIVRVQVHGSSGGGKQPRLVATGADGEWAVPLELNGWQTWFEGEIPDAVVGADGTLTVSVTGSMGAGDWGFIDGFVLTPAGS